MEDEMTPNNEINNATTQTTVSNEENLISKEKTASTSQKDEHVMIDIENKMAIAYNVLKACIIEKKEKIYYFKDSILKRLEHLTKLPSEILSAVLNTTKERNIILEESVLETPDKDFLIRRILTQYYVNRGKIPKSEFLANIVDQNKVKINLLSNKTMIDDHGYLDKQLKRSGYIWRRLHNTKRAIIVEHPKRVIERQRYLQKIFRYRNENRRIVYVDTKILSRANEDIHQFEKYLHVVFIVIANNNKGVLNGNIFFNTAIFKCQKLIEDYIVKNVIPKLTEPSVLVLEDKPYYRKSLPVPTIESAKSEMIEWLENNEIPHEKTFHRSELFELIQKSKNKSDLHKFDAVLYSHGHEILRRPTKTDYLNYYKPLWDHLSINEDIIISISKKSLDFWNNLEETIVRNEKTVHNEDLEMENITDKILTMAINTDVNNLANLECDKHADSLSQEEILIEVKNSFSPEDLDALEQQYLLQIENIECATKQLGNECSTEKLASGN